MHGWSFKDWPSLEVGDELIDSGNLLKDVGASGHQAIELSSNAGLEGLSLDNVGDGSLVILVLIVNVAVRLGVVGVNLQSQAFNVTHVEYAVACGDMLLELGHGNHTVPSAHWGKHCVQRVESSTSMAGL